MPAPVTLTDPTYEPVEKRSFIERFFLQFMNDERDLPFIWLSLQITFVLIPAAAFLFWPGMFRWWMAPLYWVLLFAVFIDRYILMLHNTSHRRLFKRKYKQLNLYIPWVLGPFCGETPETYQVHHITMHHAEGNLPEDLSSTMRFQRDSAMDFLRYWSRFFFLVLVDMTRYQLRKNRPKVWRRMMIGEFTFYAVMAVLLWLNWAATLVVFIVPFFMVRLLMMCGNWGQHAFIDASDPGNDYKNSITCINTRYNRRAFNDGYHIGHHVMATRHWTEMPQDFLDQRDIYARENAIVFEGIDFFQVWAFLMLKRYDWLASHFVELRDEPRSKDEIIALLKERTKRIDVPAPSAMSAQVPAPA